MGYWVEDKETGGLRCKFTPHCHFCGAFMEFSNVKVHNFEVPGLKERSFAMDVEVLCPKCGSWDVFGVAISRSQYERLYKEIAGKISEEKQSIPAN